MKGKEPKKWDALVRTILLLLMLVTVCFTIQGGKKLVSPASSGDVGTSGERPCVVIDAGHGGSR